MSEATGCGDTHCITCSDEALPMRVLEPGDDGVARCLDEHGSASLVMTDLVGPVAEGDGLLVHAGVALSRADAGGAG